MDSNDLRVQRLRSQRLTARRPGAAVGQVVADVFALQAQDEPAAALGIWARSDGLRAADVAHARNRERSIVRTWCLRGTLHLLGAQDVCWLLDLLRPTLINANRARRAELGLDDATTTKAVQVLVDMLASHGSLTRREIAQRLAEQGIPSAGQATIHVVWRAALDAQVCYGPDRDGEATFVLLDDWLPPTPVRDRDCALAELARRYLAAYGPARPDDLAAWSGLSRSDARRGWAKLADEVVEIETSSGPMWMLAARRAWFSHSASSAVRLLPAFDGLWLGYRDRDGLLPAAYRTRVYPGGGVLRPCVLVDGQPVGTWTRRARSTGTDVVFDLWQTLEPQALEALQATVADLGRFLGRPTRAIL